VPGEMSCLFTRGGSGDSQRGAFRWLKTHERLTVAVLPLEVWYAPYLGRRQPGEPDVLTGQGLVCVTL
jgi:hypothetical protein